jgi:hypothetical protein
MFPKSVSVAVALHCATLAGGCSLWHPPDAEISELPAPRMSSDSVVWEIAMVCVPLDDAEFHSRLWNEVDEQHLPTDVTRRLAANGFRCGVVGMQLPSVLRERLDRPQPEAADSASAVPIGELVTAFPARRLQARAGQRYEIVSPHIQNEMAILIHDEGQIVGMRYDQAQCLLAVTSDPHSDGRVRLEVTPEVHHGPARQQFTGRGGVLQMQAKRDAEVFQKLRIETMLSPGQTLVLTQTFPGKGLGGEFFTESINSQYLQKVLMIRLAQTQDNGLYSSEPVMASNLITSDQ